MNPILDQLLVALMIAGALGFFVVRMLKDRKKGCGAGDGCGCSGSKLAPGKAPVRKE